MKNIYFSGHKTVLDINENHRERKRQNVAKERRTDIPVWHPLSGAHKIPDRQQKQGQISMIPGLSVFHGNGPPAVQARTFRCIVYIMTYPNYTMGCMANKRCTLLGCNRHFEILQILPRGVKKRGAVISSIHAFAL